jgi:hypothetical protein
VGGRGVKLTVYVNNGKIPSTVEGLLDALA